LFPGLESIGNKDEIIDLGLEFGQVHSSRSGQIFHKPDDFRAKPAERLFEAFSGYFSQSGIIAVQ